ncbi:MAG: DUF262 domain-containing protein, partial [Planctomycetaceae bacterium]
MLQSGNSQYLVPFFQRYYSWKAKEWQRLWDDLLALSTVKSGQHFMGALVCASGDAIPGEVTPYQIIDGQQRLTTITILLLAIRDVARTSELTDLEEEVTEDYLIHKRNKGLDRYRLLPRIGDREVLQSLIEPSNDGSPKRVNIVKAHAFFQQVLDEHIEASEDAPEIVLRSLFKSVVDRLSLVVITIDDENPYEIFESLNFKGLPLQQSDLIRNFLFMRIPRAEQQEFNENHWQAFEAMLGEDARKRPIKPTRFYRNYLLRNGDYIRREEVYPAFKREVKTDDISAVEATTRVKRFLRFQLQILSPTTCGSVETADVLEQILQLDIATAHPLLLHLMDRADDGRLTDEGLRGCLRMIASFALRRSICGESTRPYSKWFVDVISTLGQEPVGALESFLLSKGWPDDAAMVKSLMEFELYRREPKKTNLMLTRLELAVGHKEPVPADRLTIEHVMPQTISDDSKGQAWREMLGENWTVEHKKLVHTLGNLTLTGYNSDLSNKGFREKLELLRKSHIDLNDHFCSLDSWDSTAIRQRSELLGTKVCELWPRPAGGEPYVPTHRQKEEEREFYIAYWEAFATRLAQSDLEMEIRRIRSNSWLHLVSRRKAFWFYIVVYREENSIEFGIEKSGKNGEEYMSLLWEYVSYEACERVEQDLGETIDWDSDDHAVCVERTSVPVRDRSDW